MKFCFAYSKIFCLRTPTMKKKLNFLNSVQDFYIFYSVNLAHAENRSDIGKGEWQPDVLHLQYIRLFSFWKKKSYYATFKKDL